MSQQTLASLLGISHTAVSRWESGHRHLRSEAAVRYVMLLHDLVGD